MGILIIGGVLFGTILGRFFKVFILIPGCTLAIILVLASPTAAEHGIWVSLLEIGVVITSLQVGYAVGLVTANISTLLERAQTSWGQAPSTASRSIHVR